MPITIAARPDNEPAVPAVIVFGLDHTNKPHASSFAADDMTGAEAAAMAMGMASLRTEGDELRQLATRLPVGKLFASGRAFVPFVKASVFDEIGKLAPTEVRKLATTRKLRLVSSGGSDTAKGQSFGKSTAPVVPHFPIDWPSIKVGSIVLAHEADEEGWFESIVMELLDERWLFLQWRDWPELPKFRRERHELGLLPPIKAAA